MTRQQRWILTNFVLVIVITVTTVLSMIELRHWVNRSEATRAMEQLQASVAIYRQKNGFVPPESYVENIVKTFEGNRRLGNLIYRARWITFDSKPDTILAFVRKNEHTLFLKPGAIVLRFDGTIVWMDKESFDKLLASQQTPEELAITPK